MLTSPSAPLAGAPGRRPTITTKLGAWTATSRQATVIGLVKQLYGHALAGLEHRRPLVAGRRPLGVALDVEWTPTLRLRVIEDRDDVRAHWLHLEGPRFRLAARVRPDDGPRFAGMVVVSFVGDDRAAARVIGEALSTPL